VSPQPHLAILASSHLGPDGYGNDRTGLRPWPAEIRPSLESGNVEALHWRHLFPTEAQRFARMDWLSRVALLAVELLDAQLDLLPLEARDQTGVCLETSSGCLTTDLRFLQSPPRPSLFTYTLPSTAVGEICIRHRLRGPVLCLLSADASGRQALRETADWVVQGDAGAALCVRCEALAADARPCLPDDAFASTAAWFGDALLLGRAAGAPRERPIEAGFRKFGRGFPAAIDRNPA